MIVHLVLFRLRPGVRREDPRVQRWVARMHALPGQIDSIRDWQHGWNETADDQSWDYGLRALFDDRESLEAYFAHPAHQPLLAQWEEIGELAFCDFAW